MKRLATRLLVCGMMALIVSCGRDTGVDTSLFTVEFEDGVRIIRNHGPQQADAAGVRLELTGKIGKLEAEREADILYDPVDVARLSNGDILILEREGACVKRYDKDHAFIGSFGQKGQGPGDFQFPYCLRLDHSGKRLFVGDYKISVLSLDGAYEGGFTPERIGGSSIHEEYRTSGMAILSGPRIVLPSHPSLWSDTEQDRLLSMYDENGRILCSFGEVEWHENSLLTLNANTVFLAADDGDNLYVTYAHQNRVSKYTSGGRLVFSAARPLPYAVKNTTTSEVFRSGEAKRIISWPSVTWVAKGIGLDHKGRIWVWTFLKQPDRFLRFDEENSPSECYVFDVFNTDGILLFRVGFPDVWCDHFSLSGDRIYLIDSQRESCVYEYRIVKEGPNQCFSKTISFKRPLRNSAGP